MGIDKEKPEIKIPLIQGCLLPILFVALTIMSVRECQRADIRLEQDKIKLQQLKDSVSNDTILTDKTTYITSAQEFQKIR
jgi:hypothetical protein